MRESFVLANDTDQQAAERFIAHYQGKSYVDLQLSLVPRGGSWDILVWSESEANEDEVRNLLASMMYTSICRTLT